MKQGNKQSITVGLSSEDKCFHIICTSWLLVSALLILYPLVYVAACSLSDTSAVLEGRVFLLPQGLTLNAYRQVFEYKYLMTGFFNSLFYAAGGTVVGVIITLLAAYPVSRKDLPDRKIVLTFFVITMFFSGGLIPSYILMRNLHLTGTRWALVIGVGFSCYNMVIVKTYFQSSLSQSLLDAAHIDGCGEFRFFLTIALPLSSPVVAVMVLFYAVGAWNSYFSAMIYLTNPNDFNFQQVLRDILFVAQQRAEGRSVFSELEMARRSDLLVQVRYSVLIVGTLPMMILYPFIQKYFIKGMMIGSLKE
ncbi:MAG: carbohydrate ABC transporter permease [Treponema sp.]|jgi:ABC-type glycerol-3-phosphate transport system permease component|nr:carbohydrate ABC transporter permease [Treponema sp.]